MISLEANEVTLKEKDMALMPVRINTNPGEKYHRKNRLGKAYRIDRTRGGRFGDVFFQRRQ